MSGASSLQNTSSVRGTVDAADSELNNVWLKAVRYNPIAMIPRTRSLILRNFSSTTRTGLPRPAGCSTATPRPYSSVGMEATAPSPWVRIALTLEFWLAYVAICWCIAARIDDRERPLAFRPKSVYGVRPIGFLLESEMHAHWQTPHQYSV